jgi:hypothetical protein
MATTRRRPSKAKTPDPATFPVRGTPGGYRDPWEEVEQAEDWTERQRAGQAERWFVDRRQRFSETMQLPLSADDDQDEAAGGHIESNCAEPVYYP